MSLSECIDMALNNGQIVVPKDNDYWALTIRSVIYMVTLFPGWELGFCRIGG